MCLPCGNSVHFPLRSLPVQEQQAVQGHGYTDVKQNNMELCSATSLARTFSHTSLYLNPWPECSPLLPCPRACSLFELSSVFLEPHRFLSVNLTFPFFFLLSHQLLISTVQLWKLLSHLHGVGSHPILCIVQGNKAPLLPCSSAPHLATSCA